MTLVERYLFRQLTLPVLGAVVALAAVATLSQTLSALDVIVQNGQSPVVLAKLTALALPPVISMILPVAVFVGALIGLNRLQIEQEIVICYAAGMNRWRVISPALKLGVIFTLVALFLNIWVQPLSARLMRVEFFKVKTDLAAALVHEGQFVEAGSGLTVYVRSIDQNGLLRNPFIHVQKPDGTGATAYAAQEGRIVKRNGQPALILRHGSSEEFAPSGVLNYLSYDEYLFDLSPFIKSDEAFRYKISDLWMHELFFPNLDLPWERKNQKKFLAEAHARIANPLYNLAFMAIALAGVLSGPFSRLGYGRTIARASAMAAGVRIMGFAVEAAAAGNAWLNVLQYLVPVVATVWALRLLFRQKVKRWVPIGHGQLAAAGGA